jgi:hypothetical protein
MQQAISDMAWTKLFVNCWCMCFVHSFSGSRSQETCTSSCMQFRRLQVQRRQLHLFNNRSKGHIKDLQVQRNSNSLISCPNTLQVTQKGKYLNKSILQETINVSSMPPQLEWTHFAIQYMQEVCDLLRFNSFAWFEMEANFRNYQAVLAWTLTMFSLTFRPMPKYYKAIKLIVYCLLLPRFY